MKTAYYCDRDRIYVFIGKSDRGTSIINDIKDGQNAQIILGRANFWTRYEMEHASWKVSPQKVSRKFAEKFVGRKSFRNFYKTINRYTQEFDGDGRQRDNSLISNSL